MTATGTCDCCDARNVEVCRCWVTGIETFACEDCRSGTRRPRPRAEASYGGPLSVVLLIAIILVASGIAGHIR